MKTAPQDLPDIAEFLIDDRVGIIHHLKELPKEAGAPDFFHFYAQACNTSAFSGQKNSADAGGASAKRETAVAKAIGEAVERYSSAIFEAQDLPLTSWNSAPFPCIHPEQFALYSPGQYQRTNFPFVPFDQSSTVRWTPAVDPLSGEQWFVPAAMVYMPYFFDRAHGESPIVQPVSTGLACHCSKEGAANSAICEVIERDAFTITWQASLGMPKVKIGSLSQSNQDLVKRFRRTGDVITILNITLDVEVPTILSVLQNSSPDAPALVFATASHLDPEQAVRKSLEELAHTRRLAQLLKSNLPCPSSSDDYDTIVTQNDHVGLYCFHENAQLANFIFLSKIEMSFLDIPNDSTGNLTQDFQTVLKKIKAVNHTALLVDLTSSDIQGLGLSVFRAIIPGFQPLFFGHSIRSLGGRRLWDIPQCLGYTSVLRGSGDNPAPHPFP